MNITGNNKRVYLLTSVALLVFISVTAGLKAINSSIALTYPVVDGGQQKCYDNYKKINAPLSGQSFYGQDAQYSGNPRNYTLSADGKTVRDNITNLTWMRGPNITNTIPLRADKKDIDSAALWVTIVNAANYGGFNDWRIPTIKEMYSLYFTKGTDPSNFTGSNLSVLMPFIDTAYFHFAYGQTNLGERLIDSQYGTNTKFILDPSGSGSTKLFGVNFADGRIKGYDLIDALSGSKKKFFWQLVRGDTTYGKNNFLDNNDQTVTDQASGLMWSKADNGSALTWQNALAWVQQKNTENYLGHNDWRMPDVNELQSIVNYSNAPDFNGLPAINTNYFTCSSFINENGQPDFPYYWSSSTHAPYSLVDSAHEANYVAFGRALGWPTTTNAWIDVHGAGAQRSDPKTGPPFNYAIVHTVVVNGVTYTGYSWGPQGDAIRGMNYVRLVRTVSTVGINNQGSVITNTFAMYQNYPNPFNPVTTIKYDIPKKAFVKLTVYDILGKEIETLVDENKLAGNYSTNWNASNYPSGIYFYIIRSDEYSKTMKMILIK